MPLIDLSHPITADMPVYPGTRPPVVTRGCSLQKDGFEEKKITFYSHTGTHMDAPAHILENGPTLDQLGLDHFYGRAVMITLLHLASPQITLGHLEPHQAAIADSDFVLLRTGWEDRWGRSDYFEAFPVLTSQAADWIAARGLKGLGVDAVSVDAVASTDFPIHKRLLGSGMVIIENLAGLNRLPTDRFLFSCFPLPFQKADGSPVRAVAIIP